MTQFFGLGSKPRAALGLRGALVVSVVGLLAACLGSGARPVPVPGGTLGLSGERAGRDQPSGPLKVAFVSPEGPVSVVTEVSVVFDRPVRPLELAGDGPAPFRITPSLPGSFRWVGSRAAVFTPEKRLPLATHFDVEVAAGLAALDGTKLAEARTFAFETRRPQLVSATPGEHDRGVPLDTALQVELDQLVTPDALRAAAKLEMTTPRSTTSIPFEVTRDPKRARVLWLRPRRLLSPASAVTLTLAASLRGTEGPLAAGEERSVTFHTYDPLRLNELSCARERETGPCDATSSVSLLFNNSIKPRSLASRLRVTPDVGAKLSAEQVESDATTSYLELPGRFQAGQSYQLQIEPGVVDEFGQTLQKPVTLTFGFADHHPQVDIGAVGRNFAGRQLSLPIASRNVGNFELFTAALGPRDLLDWQEARRPGPKNLKDLDWLARFKGTKVQRIAPHAAKNQIERTLLDVSKLLPGGRGALAIGARYKADQHDWDAPPNMKVVSLSDLALSAKLSRFGSLVWVTDRNTNAPVAGAEVVLAVPGRPDRVYTTRSDGLAEVPAVDYAPNLEDDSPEAHAILLARKGQDSVFSPVSEYLESWRLDVPADFTGALKPYGILFTDRGIYRPGDELWVKGVVRQPTPTGNALPGEKPVKVSLRSPSGEELSSADVMLSGFGTLSTKLRVPAGAELGSYYASVSGLGNERFLEQTLEVAEYRPVELRVTATTDRPSYVRGDTAKLDVKADYLYGAAAAGLQTTLAVSRGTTWFDVPGADGFSTNASVYYEELPETSPAGELRREERKLDAQGRVSWSEKLDLPGQRGTELLRLDSEVTDVSRRSVAGSSSALVHPAAFYVGLKLEREGFVEAPAKLKPQLLAFEPTGRRLSGKRLSVELIERRYTFARESSGGDYRGVSKVVDRSLGRCEVLSANEPTSCELAVPAAGYYLLVARGKDDRGNLAEAASFIYASGPGEPTWQDSERRSVNLVLDKKSYRIGERAKVLVKSPYKEAEAWITVERSGVYQSFYRVLRGTAPSFEIPVTAELLPNAFVGVRLLPRRSGKTAPLEPGSYRVGYAALSVNGEGRRLGVKITPNRRDYLPGDAIEVTLAVKDAKGAAAANTEVTLYAADEGVLSLIDYHTPDPLQTFSGARPLQVATLESRDAEGRILLESLGGRDKGRDGGGGGESNIRRDFRQTAYFNPKLITDARGEVKASFKLPESLTTFRLMAVAVSKEDRYGYAQERVTTSKPLMARPALPRLLRAGDSVELGVIVSKKGVPGGNVKVTAVLTGLEATGALTQELLVPENGSVEARFAARAVHPGEANVRFELSAGALHDVVAQKLPIAAPMALEAAAIYGETTAAQSEKLGALSGAREDVGKLSVSLSSTALVGIDQTALDLIDYPYSCTEQLSSRILPLVALGELSRALGFKLPPDSRRRAEAAVSEVLARQQGDGGFGMWPESSSSSDWVSPYATMALLRASRAGIAVPKPALERARERLRALVNGPLSQVWQAPAAAFAVDVLGELGAPDAGAVNRLFERRKELPLFGKALLLHAAVGAKLASDVPTQLTREVEAALHVNGDRAFAVDDGGGRYVELLDSAARTQALVLRALAARGKHPLLSGLARGLMDGRRKGTLRTTQEGAWALLALDDYRRVAEPEAPAFDAKVLLGEQQLGAATFKQAPPLSHNFELPLAPLLQRAGESLVFEKQGSGKLFYEARLQYVRRELPKTPLDAGFFIEKSLHAVSADPAHRTSAPGMARELAAGDLVLVDVTVVTPATRQFVVVDDALPAGLEAIDPRLFTTADWLRNTGVDADSGCPTCSGGDAEGDDAPGFAPAYQRSEVRDDRMLFFADELPPGFYHYRYLARATTRGRFVVPPARASEMYEPEVFGRTGAAEVLVR